MKLCDFQFIQCIYRIYFGINGNEFQLLHCYHLISLFLAGGPLVLGSNLIKTSYSSFTIGQMLPNSTISYI